MGAPQACELAEVGRGVTLGLGRANGGGARCSDGLRRGVEVGLGGVLFDVVYWKFGGMAISRRRRR